MKNLLFIILLIVFISCNNSSNQIDILQNKIDSLKLEINNTYKPGFGTFMGYIQVHHAKLWFAGINANWQLAEYEIHEMEESFEDLQKYVNNREETKTLPIIYPLLDSLKLVIKKSDLELFKKQYTALTLTCNECHKAVKYNYNSVKIPDNPPFGNQIFSKSN